MGRTFTAASRGLDAVGTNPANLALPDSGSVHISLLPIGVHAGSDFLTYDLYRSYFTGVETDSGRVGRYLGDQEKQRILDAFRGDVGEISAQVGTRLFGFLLRIDKIGTFALTADYDLSGSVVLPRQYVNFLLHGNIPGSTFDFRGVDARAYWRRNLGLSFGSALPKPVFLEWLAGGIGVKLVQGFGYYEVERFSSTLHTAENGLISGNISYSARWSGSDFVSDPLNNLFQPPAGSGLGLDGGLSAGITKWLSLGISITDIGNIRWSREVTVASADTTVFVDDPSTLDQLSKVGDVVKGRKKDGAAFSTSLPTTLHCGFSAELQNVPGLSAIPGELTVAGDYTQGLAGPASFTEKPRFSVGLEYRPWHWLPLRSGVSFGGFNSFSLACGLGVNLGAFDLDLATEDVDWLFASGRTSSASVAVGMRFRFLD